MESVFFYHSQCTTRISTTMHPQQQTNYVRRYKVCIELKLKISPDTTYILMASWNCSWTAVRRVGSKELQSVRGDICRKSMDHRNIENIEAVCLYSPNGFVALKKNKKQSPQPVWLCNSITGRCAELYKVKTTTKVRGQRWKAQCW